MAYTPTGARNELWVTPPKQATAQYHSVYAAGLDAANHPTDPAFWAKVAELQTQGYLCHVGRPN